MNFNNFQLFNDEDIEMFGTQMPQNVDGSRDMSMRKKIIDPTRNEDEIGKKQRCRIIALKSKGTLKK